MTALQILSGNATGDFMVRHGGRECVVAVETADGHQLEWRRKAGTVSYRLNGRDVHRLQGSVPDDLHQLLRLPFVEAEGGDFEIHFAEQKNPIFLLNETAGRRATFFASSSDAVKLIEMQSLHRRKTQDAKGRESDLVKREGKLKARLEALSTLGEIGNRLTDLEECHKAAVDGTQAIEKLCDLVHQIVATALFAEKWASTVCASSTLTPPPALAATRLLVEVIDGITASETNVVTGEAAFAALRPLVAPPALFNTTAIGDMIRNLVSSQMQINANGELRALCRPLSVPPTFPVTSPLDDLIDDLQIAVLSIQAMEDQRTALSALLAPPEAVDTERLRHTIIMLTSVAQCATLKRALIEALSEVIEPPVKLDLNKLLETIERIAEAEQLVLQTESNVQQLCENLAETQHMLRHLIEELDACPTCGQSFDGDRLVAVSVLQSEFERE